jgi:hypothetical protein
MQENLLRNPLTLMKRYWWMILLFVFIGNLIVWNKYRNNIPLFDYVIKLRVKGQFYDKAKEFSSVINDTLNWKSKNIFNLDSSHLSRLANIRTDSYRNEDIYIFEFILGFIDTTGCSVTIDSIDTYIKENSFLKQQYINRVAYIDDLLKDADRAIRSKQNSSDSLITLPGSLFDLKFKKYELMTYRENLIREYSIIVPPPSTANLSTIRTFRSHLVSTVLFFVFGIFVSIIIYQFRNKVR